MRGNDEIVVRVDDGVADGGEVSMFYDPMIAKLITWAPTRLEAIDAQIAALDQFVIDGISDNVDFLSALMQHPRFREGNLATDFIADEAEIARIRRAVEDAGLRRDGALDIAA